jgi:hypothetical protein
MQDELSSEVERNTEPDLITVNGQNSHQTVWLPPLCISVMAVLYNPHVMDPLHSSAQTLLLYLRLA